MRTLLVCVLIAAWPLTALGGCGAPSTPSSDARPGGSSTITPAPGTERPAAVPPRPLTREEYERRERMLEGTHLPGPTPPPPPGAPVGEPTKGTETVPSGK